MRTLFRVPVAAALSAVLVGSITLPATAATTADSIVTVEVSGGPLSISAPATAGLGAAAPGATPTVALNAVRVSDTRAGILGWSAQVSMTQLVGTDVGNSIPASAASYTAEMATVTGTAVVTPAMMPQNLSAPKVVQQASVVMGNNTATWNAALDVAIPADALADTYTATLTHSVL